MISFITRFLLLSVLMLSFLAGCASAPKPQSPEMIRSNKIVKLSQQLEYSGTRVIHTGQTMRVILPSDQLFNPHSANLAGNAHKTLNMLSELMLMLETTSIQISGYTDVEPTQLQNKALSAGQAQEVADYLWSKGVDARLMYSVGYGCPNKTTAGLATFAHGVSRRVEIEFQYLPLLSSLVN